MVSENIAIMDNIPEINLSFRSLTYTVKAKRMVEGKRRKEVYKKNILNDINGTFKPGKLTAIMGPSGAGKTSLLQVLIGEAGAGVVKGKIMANGKEMSVKEIRKMCGFVFQDDVILSTMTVYEALMMSAQLRLPDSITQKEKMERVEKMIKILHLESCRNTLVGGNDLKGISGGERKRLSVGMELIMNPSILIMDEPTSGLDTYTAFSLIKNLKDLTNTGRSIITTIHQPSSDIFNMFDELVLVSKGKIIYQGPREDVLPYFEQFGYKCPIYSNPGDFLFMKIFNAGNEEIEIFKTAEERDQKLIESYETNIGETVVKEIDAFEPYEDNFCVQREQAGFMKQTSFLLNRSVKNLIRNITLIRTKTAQTIGLGLILGLTFLDIPGRSDYAQTQDRTGSLFISAVAQVMLPLLGILSVFSSERIVCQREVRAGYYGINSYYLVRLLIEIPLQIICSSVMTFILYWLIGYQNSAEKFLIFLLYINICAIVGLSIGTCFSSLFKDTSIVLQIAPFSIIPLMLFSGLLVNQDYIPWYFSWIQYISPIKYVFEVLFKNEFEGLSIPSAGMALKQMGFTDLSRTTCGLILACMAIVLFILAYIFLFRMVNSSGKNVKYIREDKKSESKK